MGYTRNTEICRNCGACAADCSPLRHGLMVSPGNFANPGSPRCEQCGHCYSLCPHGAILATNEPTPPVAFGQTNGDREISPRSLFNLMALRRSERRFRERPVSDEVVSALLAAAAQTPSGGNSRSIECTLLVNNGTRRRLLDEIGTFYRRLARIARRPLTRKVVGLLLGRVAGAFLNDPEYRRRFIALIEGIDAGRDPVFYNAPLVMLFHSSAWMPTPEEDAVLAANNVALLAPTVDLGTCFVSMAQKAIAASKAVRRAIGLAPDQRILAVLAIGYPTAERLRPVVRVPLAVAWAEVDG